MKRRQWKTANLFGGIVLGAVASALLVSNACAAEVEEEPVVEQTQPDRPPPLPPPEDEDIRPIPSERFDARARAVEAYERAGRGWRGRPGAMLWQRMSERERDELKSFIAEHYPERYDDMLELEETDPEMFSRQLGRMLPEMMKMHELSQDDPELFEVRIAEHRTEYELRRLARRYRHAADEGQREEFRGLMRPLVERQFDLRQQRMEFEIVHLEQRIQSLRQNMERRAEDREAEIIRAIEQILHEGPRHKPGERRLGRDRERHEHREGFRGRGGPREPLSPTEPEPD